MARPQEPVTLGITDGDDVQILTGLTPADMVITGGSYGLDDGTKVKIGQGRRRRRRQAKDDEAQR